MAEYKDRVVETFYGSTCKYEVVKESGMFSTSFCIYRDGKYHRGSFGTLREAEEAARKESGDRR